MSLFAKEESFLSSNGTAKVMLVPVKGPTLISLSIPAIRRFLDEEEIYQEVIAERATLGESVKPVSIKHRIQRKLLNGLKMFKRVDIEDDEDILNSLKSSVGDRET